VSRPRAVRATVWAPRASRSVDLCLHDRRVPMVAQGNGWWRTAHAVLRAGVDYAFSVDGGKPLPDPRSPWQPDGPHGWSRWVDHAAFDWQDQAYQPPAWPGAILYEMHVGTFTPGGTFESAIDRLDEVADLGITHLELMPVAEFPGSRGWGYDGVDLYAPFSGYGGPDAMKRFVAAAHDRDLAVLLDVVYNHFGPDGNYLETFAPYLSDRYRTAWGPAVNLDGPGSDEVRRFFLDNALGWLRDYHLDGLRLDAVHALVDTSAVHFLEQLSAEVERLEGELGRTIVIVAESDLGDPRVVRPRDEHGLGIDAQWNDEFCHALHAVLSGETDGIHADFHGIGDLATAIRDVFVYTGQWSAYRQRDQGRPVQRDLPRWKFVSFLQNHDQAGNRVVGERSSQLLDPDALKVAAALILLGPNVPLLFAGEEWGAGSPFLYFTDHTDAALGEAVRRGRREEFAAHGRDDQVADPQAEETFLRSRLDWSERPSPPHDLLLVWHRRLCRLRRELPRLHAGSWPSVTSRDSWLGVERNGAFLAASFGASNQTVPVPGGVTWRLELASDDRVVLGADGLELPPRSIALLLSTV
jgi:maltooligosyltrehalose trehalohydrolase